MGRSRLFAVLLICGPVIGVCAPVARAQVTPAAAETSAPAQTEEETVVLVEAWRRDRAMDAFLRGDFATAEIEFGKNVRCIRRNELQFDASILQAVSAATNARLSPNGPGLGDVNVPTIHNLPQRNEEIRERTCFSKEWQLYMIGLSQIQLGRFAEAKKSLYTVAWLSKADLLYDAHYRIGLLELLEGNIDRANRRLVHLTRMQRSCRARPNCEIDADLSAATAYLARAVADARQGK